MALTEVSRTRIRGGTADENPADLVVYQGSNPAAGSEISEFVPSGKAWRLLSVRFALSIDTGSTPKTPVLEIQEPAGGAIFSALAKDQIAANTIGTVLFADSEAPTTTALSTWGPLLRNCLLGPGYEILTGTGIQAADDYFPPIFVVEESPAHVISPS